MAGQHMIMIILCYCGLRCEVSGMCKMYEDLGVPMVANILNCDYYKEYRPVRNASDRVKVEFTMYIQDINSINAADMDFRIDLFLHMTWDDARLDLTNISFKETDPSGAPSGSDYLILPAYIVDHIWMPDPYITNSKDAAITKLTTTYASVTLYRNSTIRYSARVYSIVGCQMEFHEYPMDVQNCSLVLQSFMYTLDEVEFLWRQWRPIMINPDLKLNQFVMKQPLQATTKRINDSIEISGVSGMGVLALVVELQFSREIGHHLVQTFVPSFLVVTLSWFSFWMGLEAIPGRVTLLVTSLLTLTTLFTGIKEDLPPVAYVKAIDIWMAGCILFVFSALGEFLVVRVIKNSSEDDAKASKVRGGNEVFPDCNWVANGHRVRTAHKQSGNGGEQPPGPGTGSSSCSVSVVYGENNRPFSRGAVTTQSTYSTGEQHHPLSRTVTLGSMYNGNQSFARDLSQSHNQESRPMSMTRAKSIEFTLEDEKLGPHASEVDICGLPAAWDTEVEDGSWKRPLDPSQQRRQSIGRLNLRWVDGATGEHRVLWMEIDRASRIVFPVMFALFCTIYFPILLSRSFWRS